MNGRDGFTLVEVLVALLLLAVGLLAIAPMFSGSLKSNAGGQDFSMLNALAKQELEQLLQYSFTDPRLAVPSGSTVSIVNQDGSTTSSSGQLYSSEIQPCIVVATGLLTSTCTTGTTISFPYELVYIVQDFPMTSIKQGSVPDPTTATDDSWTTQGAKMITVFAAAKRTMGAGNVSSTYTQATGYTRGGVLSASASGKQIRMSAIKTP